MALGMASMPEAQRREAALSLQRTRGNRFVQRMAAAQVPVQAKREPNRTGMPDGLKAGIESLSGLDMSDVRVHANSDRPARLNALAYTQGNQIYLGSGQEKHLPHEAWHVVQQKDRRVCPELSIHGQALNKDESLEKEADAKAALVTRELGQRKGYLTTATLSEIGPIQLNGRDSDYRLDIIMPGSGDKYWRLPYLVGEKDEAKKREGSKEQGEKNYFKGSTIQDISKNYKKVIIHGPTSNVKYPPRGFFDAGENSIKNNISTTMLIVDDIFKQWAVLNNPIVVNIKAHSRNAVAAIKAANKLNNQFKNNIKINLMAFDPVPGPFHNQEYHEKKMDAEINSTIIYSVSTQYKRFFNPMSVKEGQRYIMTRQNHEAGIRCGFIFNGKIYKDETPKETNIVDMVALEVASITDLPRGYYIPKSYDPKVEQKGFEPEEIIKVDKEKAAEFIDKEQNFKEKGSKHETRWFGTSDKQTERRRRIMTAIDPNYETSKNAIRFIKENGYWLKSHLGAHCTLEETQLRSIIEEEENYAKIAIEKINKNPNEIQKNLKDYESGFQKIMEGLKQFECRQSL